MDLNLKMVSMYFAKLLEVKLLDARFKTIDD